ncbi:MAG TPA: ATP-binding protein [Chloroflexota bacterium]
MQDRRRFQRRSTGLLPYGLATLGALAATLVATYLQHDLNVANASFPYVLAVLLPAAAWGLGPALFSCVLSALSFDYFLVPRYGHLLPVRAEDWLTLLTFVATALVTGHLAANLRTKAEEAQRRAREAETVHQISLAAIGRSETRSALGEIARRVVEVVGAPGGAILLADERGALDIRATAGAWNGEGAPGSLDAPFLLAMQQASEGGERVAAGSAPPWQGPSGALYLPMHVGERVIGVVGVLPRPGGLRYSPADMRVVATCANQLALALEHDRLLQKEAEAAALRRLDELKSALLSSVSHDLRTPLASIKASVTSLLDRDVELGDAAERELLLAIDEETDRLNRLVGNLLDMSRIEAGALRPSCDWCDLAEIITGVVAKYERLATGHTLDVSLPPNLPLVWVDYVHIEQVLTNLVDNAIKYSAPGTRVAVAAAILGDEVLVSVVDEGAGIPPLDQERIFDKFYRVSRRHPGQRHGTGLGLAICKGLVEAHGGRIWVESWPGRGSVFTFTIPLGERRSAIGALAGDGHGSDASRRNGGSDATDSRRR